MFYCFFINTLSLDSALDSVRPVPLFGLFLSFSLDESVYVVDAGSGLSVVCAAGGGDLEEPSLSDHPVHPTTGETGRGDGETLNLSGLRVCLSVCWFGPVVCEQTLHLRERVIGWNISQQEQIGRWKRKAQEKSA